MHSYLAHAKCIVLLTFDFDAESAQVRKSPNLPVTLSKGQYGGRVGLQRVQELLGRYGIISTFFVPSWTAQKYEDLIRSLVAGGHEIASHGYLHENFGEMTSEEEWKVHEKSVRVLEVVAGKRPLGFRAPYWEWSNSTLGFLRKIEYRYDSSLMNDDQPYVISEDGSLTGIVELPVDWSLDDWALFEIDRKGPDEVFGMWRAEFEAVYERNIPYFMLTMHPECIGRPSRIRMLELLIETMVTKPGVVFSSCADIAEYWAAKTHLEQ